jgi:hypothetical protein
MVELYFRSRIRLHSVVANALNMGKTRYLTALLTSTLCGVEDRMKNEHLVDGMRI